MISAIYEKLCPNCGGTIESERLEKGLPCTRCIPNDSKLVNTLSRARFERKVRFIKSSLKKNGVLKDYWFIGSLIEQLSDFESFAKSLGYELWSAQRSWAKRLLGYESFAIIAPTGVGKTTLLLLYALYRALENQRVYIVDPTEEIVKQTYEKLVKLKSKLHGSGEDVKILCYYSKLNKKEKDSFFRRLHDGDFDILVTTSAFLNKHFETISRHQFDILIVDDVDALLRTSKLVDKVLQLIGVKADIIEKAEKLVVSKINLLKIRSILNEKNKEKYKELVDKISKLQDEIQEFIRYSKLGQLIVASATGRATGIKAKVFREILGFEIGGIHDYMRNTIDTFFIINHKHSLNTISLDDEDSIEKLVELIRKLGDGGLIFVSKDLGRDIAKRIVKKLELNGIKAKLALAGRKFLESFAQGETDVLVGVASYYGVIVRGIDLPHRVKYAIFYGIPKHVIDLDKALESPHRLLQVLYYLAEKGLLQAEEYYKKLMKRLNTLSVNELKLLRSLLREKLRIPVISEYMASILEEIRKMKEYAVKQVLSIINDNEEDTLVIGSFVVRKLNDKVRVEIPDVYTYLQASGRTSRLLNGRMTLGLNILVPDNIHLLKLLEKKLSYLRDEFCFVDLRTLNLKDILKKIAETRRIDADKGESREKEVNIVKRIQTSLIIVESPTKARTIAYLFGKPSRRKIYGVNVYEVPIVDLKTKNTYIAQITSCKGHIFDLTLDYKENTLYGVYFDGKTLSPIYSPIKKCLNCGHGFSSSEDSCPRCGSSNITDSFSRISILRKLAMENEVAYIATDPDTEGEKIAWDLYLALKPYNDNIYRIEFHEITRRAILEALAKPRSICKERVYAQIVRRVEDRWIGFKLSNILQQRYGLRWLGAGRVQTPVLGWIIDRYEKWRKNKKYLFIVCLDNGYIVKFYTDRDKARDLVKKLKELSYVEIRKIGEEVVTRYPPAPYTTDELLHDASKKLNLTADKIMRIAQNLFEAGLITYHRTDSTTISSNGIAIAKKYLDKHGLLHLFVPRSWKSNGAHEAIRPTLPLSSKDIVREIINGNLKISIKLTKTHLKLYDLIFSRFIASQMKETTLVVAKTSIRILDEIPEVIVELPVRIVKEGFLPYTNEKFNEELRRNSKMLVQKIVPVTSIKKILSSQYALYTHGDVVRLMKERGLGRPSTYAKILDSIKRHGYIILSAKRKYLIPTKLAFTTYGFLTNNFSDLVSEEVTRLLEEQMRMIENGELDPINPIRTLYSRIIGIDEKGYLIGQELATTSLNDINIDNPENTTLNN